MGEIGSDFGYLTLTEPRPSSQSVTSTFPLSLSKREAESSGYFSIVWLLLLGVRMQFGPELSLGVAQWVQVLNYYSELASRHMAND